jgi:large subunit ribosomal protein L29
MKADKLRNMEEHELQKELREIDEHLFRFHFQKSMGQMDGLKKARSMRRDRARIYTVLTERAQGAKK